MLRRSIFVSFAKLRQYASQGPGSKGNPSEEIDLFSKFCAASMIVGLSVYTAYNLGAEKGQAEIDAHVFGEEKKMLKEKYEKELKDARARQLMYAEEAAILDKELNKERAKAAAAIKLLQEKAEDKHKMELERKENEAELELKNIQEWAKAELAAAIASEKTIPD